jgi:hypothetical protein
MAWYNPFSWGKEVATNILDKDNGLIAQAGDWIGKQQYTDQEKADDSKELTKGVVKYAIDSLNENTVRSKTRRAIAVKWIELQINLIYFCVLCAIFGLDELLVKISVFALSDIVNWGTGAISVKSCVWCCYNFC